MKLLCETTVQYRAHPGCPTPTTTIGGGGGGGRNSRPQKSTLALGAHPPNDPAAELFIILFTAQNKTGTRYRVRDNLERVFTKFVADGKATISLRQPAHDLQIRCDAVQLRCFLQALRLGLQGGSSADGGGGGVGGGAVGKREQGRLGLATLATTAIPQSSHPVTKLTVRSRGDYPLRGLPKTLVTLTVTGIQRARFDTQILFMRHLTTLSLSDNCIGELPRQLGEMRCLQVLDMGRNRLGEGGGTSAAWQWLEGQPLQQSLLSLTLSGNGLRHFPFGLVKMRRLQTLKLDDNRIERLPFAVRRMKSLKFLHISGNLLTSLPSTIGCNTFNTLDLSGNPFDEPIAGRPANEPDAATIAQLVQQLPICVPQLWECAARVVSAKRLAHSPQTLPVSLIDLVENTPLCACGALCFSAAVQRRSHQARLRTEHLIYNGGGRGATGIFCDAVYCSRRCMVKYALNGRALA